MLKKPAPNNCFKNMDYSISIKNHHPENLVGGFACITLLQSVFSEKQR